jgi:hypothetical protein
MNFESSSGPQMSSAFLRDVSSRVSAGADVEAIPRSDVSVQKPPRGAAALAVAFAACVRVVGGGRARRRRAPAIQQQAREDEQPLVELGAVSLDFIHPTHERRLDLTTLSWKQQLQHDIAIANGVNVEKLDLPLDAFVAFDLRSGGGSVFGPSGANASNGSKLQLRKRRRVRVRLLCQGDPQRAVSFVCAPGEEFADDVNVQTFDLQALLHSVAMLMRRRAIERQQQGRGLPLRDALNPIPTAEGPYVDDESIVIRRHCALPCSAKDDRELTLRCYCWHLARYVAMTT